MRLASKFLATLDSNFDPSHIEKAFVETNQLFLSQGHVSDEEFSDLLDVCKEFLPLPYLMTNRQYKKFWARLEHTYFQYIKEYEQRNRVITRRQKGA